MDRLKHILALILLVSYQHNTIAQNKYTILELNAIDKTINESIFISTNTNTLLTGETLYYKLFCLDKTSNMISSHSKIGYVELIDSNKKLVFSHKLFLKNGSENGDFFIPTSLQTGNYKLIGYTNWMLNKSDIDYFNIDISIINPYQISPKSTISSTDENQIGIERQNTSIETTPNLKVINALFSIETNKKTYSNRERVDLKLTSNSIDFLNGNYSLSVRKTDDLNFNRSLSFNTSVVFKLQFSHSLRVPE